MNQGPSNIPVAAAEPDYPGRAEERAAAAGAPVVPLDRSSRLLATAALMLASAMQAADVTIANVALPQLERDLGGGLVTGAWVVTSYLCATAVVAPLTGWLRRRFGGRNLFLGAVGVFALASLLCALASSPAQIILFRILQGAGGGVIHPLSQAILLDLYPRERHGRMIGAWGATVMIGPIVGPALGGIITDLASWRFVFLINLPLAAAAIWAMGRSLPRTAPDAELPIDLLGVALLAIAVGGLQLVLARGIGQSWLSSPELLIEAVSAAIAIGALIARAQHPGFAAFRPAVFADVNFAAAAFYNFTVSALLFVVVVLVPALCQGPLGLSATTAGLAIVPRGVATMLMMLLAGQSIGRVDGRILLAVGLALMAAGLTMLSEAGPPVALPWIVIGSTVQAVGGGVLLTCLSTFGFATLPAEMRTDAAGAYSLLRQLGCASGVALMTAVLHARVDTRLDDLRGGLDIADAPVPPHFLDIAGLHAYAYSFRAMAVAALVIMPGLLLFRVRPSARPLRWPA